MAGPNVPGGSIMDFGYSETQLFSGTLTSGSPTGATSVRKGGLIDGLVTGVFTITGGTPDVTLILEGSMDGTNWHVIAQTIVGTNFTVTGQQGTLNADSGNATSYGRFSFVRARAVENVGGAWSLAVVITGVRRDGQAFNQSSTLTRSAAVENGLNVVRGRGTRYGTCQAVLSGVVLGALSAYRVNLQLSPDDGVTYFTIATVDVIADGSFLLEQATAELIDFGGGANWRVQVEDVGTALGGEAYTAIIYLGTDNSDWLWTDSPGSGGGGSGPGGVSEQLIKIVTSQAVVGGDDFDVTYQVLDNEGNPLPEEIALQVAVYDTSEAGLIDLSTNGTFTAVSVGTAISGLATNRIAAKTDAAGVLTARVNDVATETIFTAVIPGGVPQIGPNPHTIVESSEESLVFP